MKLNEIPKMSCIGIIRIYQNYLSPKMKNRCRFYPTCSNYGILAINKYGAVKGVYKTINRLYRCRPNNLKSCIDYP